MSDRFSPVVGCHVLLGRRGITLPSDWIIGRVEWVGQTEILVSHDDLFGPPEHTLFLHGWIIGMGTVPNLCRFRDRCAREVRGLKRKITKAEAALTAAQAAVWDALDRMAEEGTAE